MDKVYKEMFGQVLKMWEHIVGKKGSVAKEFPPDITERLACLEKELEILKVMTEQRNIALGVAGKDPEKFVEENSDKLPKKDLQFFEQIEQMKKEIGFVGSVMKKVAMEKKQGAKPMASEDATTEKGKSEAIRNRKRRLKRTGANDKWIPM